MQDLLFILDDLLGLEGWLASHSLLTRILPWLLLYSGSMHLGAVVCWYAVRPLGAQWVAVKKLVYLAMTALAYLLAVTFKDLVGFQNTTQDAAAHFMSDCVMVLAVHRWAEILFFTYPKVHACVGHPRLVPKRSRESFTEPLLAGQPPTQTWERFSGQIPDPSSAGRAPTRPCGCG